MYLAQEGHTLSALDYPAEGVHKAQRLTTKAGVEIETRQADVCEWVPSRSWAAVVVTFLHRPAEEQASLYRLLRRCLRPDGCLVAEGFCPEQRTEGYTSGGSPEPPAMAIANELRDHFAEAGNDPLQVAEPILNEGVHQGRAVTIRFVRNRPSSS